MSDHRLLRAARRQPVDKTPVWFMRQAGRFMKEYRELRKRHSILDLCTHAELAAEVTMLPPKLLSGIDAAIIFSDILMVPRAMGVEIAFVQGEGPEIGRPVRTERDVEGLRPAEPARLQAVYDAIRIVKRELGGRMPLIGFAGAPFTLASYLVEGGPSRHYLETKRFMRSPAWGGLMAKLSDSVIAHLREQISAGAEVVQLFDSWAGALGPEDYEEYVLPWSRRIFDALKGTVPTIHFATDSAGLLELMKAAGGDVIGVDWRVGLDDAWKRLGDVGVQGNLDPEALFAPRADCLRRVDAVLRRAANRPGHIFNLGHGILPETPVENVVAVIEHVHARTTR